MSKTSLNVTKKIISAILVLGTILCTFLPILRLDSVTVNFFQIRKVQDTLMELGNYKDALPLYLYVAFFVALAFYLVSVFFTSTDKDDLAFLFVLLGFLGNAALLIYLLPPLVPESISCFTVSLYCYIGLNLILLIYSFCCMLRNDFVSKLKYMYFDSVKQLSSN